MGVAQEYAAYTASTAVERIAAAALGVEFIGQTSSATWEEIRPLLKDAVKPASQWLDLGCGRGAFSVPLAQRDCAVTGVDLSVELLAVAKALAQRQGLAQKCTFLQRDFTSLPMCEDAQFDGAICIGSLYWTLDIHVILKEWRRILKPDAPLIIFTNCADGDLPQELMGQLGGTHFLGHAELCSALQQAGFALAEQHDDSLAYQRWLTRWCAAMDKEYAALQSCMGPERAQQFVRRFQTYRTLASLGQTRRIKMKVTTC